MQNDDQPPRRPVATLEWFLLLVLAVSVQLLLTLDYSGALRSLLPTTNEQLIKASLTRAAAGAAGRTIPAAPRLRCSDALLPTRSERAVKLGPVGIRTTVVSRYRGPSPRGGDAGHAWSYSVEFANEGRATVQLLSRRWAFRDAGGDVTAVAGPGAVGETKVLRPGEAWRYDSGTTLATTTGSMSGRFVFEVLETPAAADAFVVDGVPIAPGDMVEAPVDRLALTPDDGAASAAGAPCGARDEGSLACTSVGSARRVIAGVTSSVDAYDVQINNARTDAVRIVRHEWTAVR